MTTPSGIRNRRPTKKAGGRRPPPLGQHFLTSSAIIRTMADTAGVTAQEHVLEIGPGKGILTEELLARGANVTAVEKDPLLYEYLGEKFARYIATKQLALISGDIRNFDPGLLPAYKLVANIPYYLSGYIIEKFLSCGHQPISMTLMVQREVAERICAKDGRESLLSIAVKAYGTPSLVRRVARGSFSPPPEVDSAIIHIANISKKTFKTLTEKDFFAIIRAGFSHRRKKLLNNLSLIHNGQKLISVFQTIGLNLNTRAEELSLEQWVALAREIGTQNAK